MGLPTTRRLTAALLACALAAGVAACGSDDDGGGGSGSSGGSGGDKKYTLGVSNTLVGNGWREEMICAVKAQALADGSRREGAASPTRTALLPSRSPRSAT